MTVFDDLMTFQRVTEALGQVAGRTGWDQETVMPEGAAPQRAEEMAALEAVLHARRTDPQIAEWLETAQAPDEVGQAQLRHMRRNYDRSCKVPADLATEIARVTSAAQRTWAQARADDDFAAFAPTLATVLDLRRQEGAALADGGDVYDALLDGYEPGATGDQLAQMFDAMRPRLVALRDAVLDRPAPAPLSGRFDSAQQMAMAQEVAVAFGYDMNHGRIDTAAHPFSSGSGLDVRITTRTDETDPFGCLYSTIHEVGHAGYEQNIDRAYLLTPLGQGVSMGVHESQSRIYENQIGRSKPFCHWLYARMVGRFGDMGLDGPDAFYAAANRVERGFIRTESDELSYNLHVMLRFGLERDLIQGRLEVADLEEAWNSQFSADFGVDVPRASLGVLQDVHWSVGLFGYFPTYSLGNLYAGCLNAAMRSAVPEVDDHLSRGDTGPALDWLGEHVQRHGGLYDPRDLITRACGHAPTETPLLDYLEAKFTALYGL